MKELRTARQLLRLVREEKREELKLIFLNEIHRSLKRAREKINKKSSVCEDLKGQAKKEFKKLNIF